MIPLSILSRPTNEEEFLAQKEYRLKMFWRCGVYRIVNLVNNNTYIGSSININRRLTQHRLELRCNKHPNHYLQNAWNKYGEENFEFQIIERWSYPEKILERENKNIRIYKPEYNYIQVNKEGIMFHSQETKDKIRDTRLGKFLSDESKHKISIANKGRIVSEETRQRMSISNKGKHHGVKGGKLSEEHKLKLSLIGKERKGALNPNSRKIIDTTTGSIFSCIREAAEYFNIPKSTLNNKLCRRRKNNTSLRYLDNGSN